MHLLLRATQRVSLVRQGFLHHDPSVAILVAGGPSTDINGWQALAKGADMAQREMPIMGLTKRVEHAPMELVRMCRHRLDAIRLCVQLSSATHESIAEALSIDKGHWSRIMQGQAHFPDTKTLELMDACGNYAPVQWEAWATGHELVERSKDVRIKELEQELERLKEAG